jgi:hypothetical protein
MWIEADVFLHLNLQNIDFVRLKGQNVTGSVVGRVIIELQLHDAEDKKHHWQFHR